MEDTNKKINFQKLSDLLRSLSDNEKKEFVIEHLLNKDNIDLMNLYDSQPLNYTNLPEYISLEEIEKFRDDK